MNTTSESATIQQTTSLTHWDEIEKRVVDNLDLNVPRDRYAFSEWRKDTEKIRAAANENDIVHRFTSPQVIQAVVDFFKADVAENKIIFDLKAARNARKLAGINVVTCLGQFDGRFVDEEQDEQVVPELLAVCGNTKSAKARLLQQVVDTSLKFAESAGQNGASRPAFPAALGDGIHEFENDLTEFINVNGDGGRQFVARLCTDREFAREVGDDADMPKCIKFLAGVVVEIGAKNKLPEKPSPIGFAVK